MVWFWLLGTIGSIVVTWAGLRWLNLEDQPDDDTEKKTIDQVIAERLGLGGLLRDIEGVDVE